MHIVSCIRVTKGAHRHLENYSYSFLFLDKSLVISLRLTLNSQSSCLSFPRAGIISVYHQAQQGYLTVKALPRTKFTDGGRGLEKQRDDALII